MSRSGSVNLPHLAARVFGAPHMIARASLDAILAALAPRLGVVAPRADAPASEGRARESLQAEDGIAVIQVIGPLVQRAGMIGPDCGDVTSYEELGQEFDAALADPSVGGIVLELDSPGGEVAGCFELVAKIAGAEKPVYAVANESAYSAAYALASACDEIYVARTGGVGSIGVVAMHLDQSAKNAKDGLKPTYIFAGDKKVDANPHEPLTDRARQDLQGEVDALYDVFVRSVSESRDMSLRDVRGTDAGTYMGEAAVEAGLADEVGSLEDAKADLRAEVKRRSSKMSLSKVAVALTLAAEASEDQVLAKLDELKKAHAEAFDHSTELEKKNAEGEATSKLLADQVAKLEADLATRDANHSVELAKMRLLEAGLPAMDKSVEEDARALFALGKVELAKRTLDRHLEGERSKVVALRDPKVRGLSDQEPKATKSKEAVLEKAKADAAALVAAKNTKRGTSAK